jgi:hypothetical protein
MVRKTSENLNKLTGLAGKMLASLSLFIQPWLQADRVPRLSPGDNHNYAPVL